MATPHADWFGRIVASLTLLFSSVFLMLVIASGQGIDVYTSTSDSYNETFPPWNVSGATFNGTNASNEDLVLVSSDDGIFTYTSPIIEEDQLIRIDDVEYRASIDESQDHSITLKIFTSNNDFVTIEEVDTLQLNDGVNQKVVDLPRDEDYRFLVRIDYSGTGQEPTLEYLQLNGATFSRDYDFTIFFEILFVWILALSALFVVVPRY